jgi:hypothetical protein
MIALTLGCSIGYFMAPCAIRVERTRATISEHRDHFFGLREVGREALVREMRHGAAVADVMLHLRSRYVSKAAILTIAVFSIPVENRSPV